MEQQTAVIKAVCISEKKGVYDKNKLKQNIEIMTKKGIRVIIRATPIASIKDTNSINRLII